MMIPERFPWAYWLEVAVLLALMAGLVLVGAQSKKDAGSGYHSSLSP